MKILKLITSLTLLISILDCATATKTQSGENEKTETTGFFVKELPNPAGTEEPVYNEKGKEVAITEEDPDFFKKPSTNPEEYFRVIITSESYELRQFRGSEEIMRKKDSGGDKNISGHITKFDKIDFKDEGTLEVIVNPAKKHIMGINVKYRAPRINDLAKIMRDDASRWEFEYKKDDEPKKSFEISYQIRLNKRTDREKVKEELKKEVAR